MATPKKKAGAPARRPPVAAQRKSYCMVCGKEKDGIPIIDDYIIKSVRWFKTNVTKSAKNNLLVVCRDCYPKYKKMRHGFERSQKIYLALGLVFAIILNIVASGAPAGTRVLALVASALIVAGLYLLPILSLNYVPKVDIKMGGEKQ